MASLYVLMCGMAFILATNMAFGRRSKLHPALHELKAIWPLPSVSRADISSTFGPRIRLGNSEKLYDFHRGIDISAEMGTPIVATMRGTFHGLRNRTNGGHTLILAHDVLVLFHGENRRILYTYYMHCSSFPKSMWALSRGAPVEKGIVVAYVGESGAAVTPHLHYEARLGSRCSLRRQLTQPDSSCRILRKDPHIHPLGLFEMPIERPHTIIINVLALVSKERDGTVRVSAPDAWPLANRYELSAAHRGGGLSSLHVLDLSLRTGFDASSNNLLNKQDQEKPYLDPISFDKNAATWKTHYVIPAGFGTKWEGDLFRLTVTNVFDQSFTEEVAVDTDSWS